MNSFGSSTGGPATYGLNRRRNRRRRRSLLRISTTETASPAQHLERARPAVDQIAHQPQTVLGRIEAELRAVGIDPYNTELSELSLALLRVGGYQVAPAPGAAENTYIAQKAGSTALVVVHEHQAGEHPELSEKAVNGFVIAVAQNSPQRGLLITDMFSPYLVYEKERNDPRCRFITRERLQPFVDSFALQ